MNAPTLSLRAAGCPPGFTLIEVAVTMAIAGVIAAIAVGVVAMFIREARSVSLDAELTESSRAGVLFVVEEARIAGGGGIPGWSAAIIEDDCLARADYPPCNGSDRLTLVQSIPRFPGCAVVAETRPGQAKVETVKVGGADVCCFHEDNFVRQVAIVWPDTMQPAVLRGVGHDCLFDVLPIVPGDLLPRPLSSSSSAAAGLVDAVIVLADVKTFYVDWAGPTRGALKMHVELNGDGHVDGERLTILDDVADFQAALGYSVPGDSLFERRSGADRWWPNHGGESGRPLDADFAPERAAILGVSVVGVARDGGRTATAQTPWGPVRVIGDVRLRTATERVRLGVSE